MLVKYFGKHFSTGSATPTTCISLLERSVAALISCFLSPQWDTSIHCQTTGFSCCVPVYARASTAGTRCAYPSRNDDW